MPKYAYPPSYLLTYLPTYIQTDRGTERPIYRHSVHPHPTPTPFCWGEGGSEPSTKFSKRGAWQDPNFEKVGCWKRGGCNFYKRNKLKSEIFNCKKSLQTKVFFSVITKNSNWKILTYWLLLEDNMGLRMKNFNILGVH